MKYLKTMVIGVILLSGCGLFKSVHKESSLAQVEVERSLSKDSSGVTIDKTITIIKEHADTTVIIPEHTESQNTYLNQDSLIKGITAIQSDLVDVRLILDPLTGVLSTLATIKKQYIPIRIDRTTTVSNDIKRSSKTGQAQSEKIKAKQKNSTVDKKPEKMGVLLIAFAFLAILIFGGYKLFVSR